MCASQDSHWPVSYSLKAPDSGSAGYSGTTDAQMWKGNGAKAGAAQDHSAPDPVREGIQTLENRQESQRRLLEDAQRSFIGQDMLASENEYTRR